MALKVLQQAPLRLAELLRPHLRRLALLHPPIRLVELRRPHLQ